MRNETVKLADRLIRQYDHELCEMVRALETRRLKGSAVVYREWQNELAGINSADELRKHAKRTARSFGGMESIGEIALADGDKELLQLIDSLFATCAKITE